MTVQAINNGFKMLDLPLKKVYMPQSNRHRLPLINPHRRAIELVMDSATFGTSYSPECSTILPAIDACVAVDNEAVISEADSHIHIPR